MDRYNYEKTLKVIEEKKINEIIDFLRNLPLFSTWTSTALLKLKYQLVQKSYIRNAIIYKEGDLPKRVYIVKNGEFQETCKISIGEILAEESSFLPKLKTRKHNPSVNLVNSPEHFRTLYVFK